MPRQHPHPQRPLRPPWRSRLAGWLRGVAESIDPGPDGLDLTGAPDFWAEHVRAAARRARKEGRVFRMRRWGVNERNDRGDARAEVPADEPSGPPAGRGPRAARATDGPGRSRTVPPTVPHRERDAGLTARDRSRRLPETPPAQPAQAGEQQDPAGVTFRPPVVRPRHAKPPSAPVPTSQAPARPEPAAPAPDSGRAGPPLVRPRNPAASLRAAVGPLPSATPTRPAPVDATPGWPRLAPVPVQVPPSNTQDWFNTPDVVAGGAAGGWPVRPAPAPRPEAASPIARVRLTEPGDEREAPRVAVPPRPEPRPAEPAVLPESLWPELPVRRPAVPVMPDPAPILLRRERLAAEQAAT